MQDVKFHEVAAIFPLMEGDALQGLADSIKANGLLEPIKLFEGKILDGRNRKTACLMAGVEPRFVDVNPEDPIAYVVAENRDRRHLTPSQWAMIAARARKVYDERAKERQKVRKGSQPGATQENLPDLSSGQARDHAGKALGVSGRTVDFATKVLKRGTPDLVKAVDEGRMAVSTAAVLATEPADVQREQLASGRHNRRYKPVKAVAPPSKAGTDGRPHIEHRASSAMDIAVIAITHLESILSDDPKREAALDKVAKWIRDHRRNP